MYQCMAAEGEVDKLCSLLRSLNKKTKTKKQTKKASPLSSCLGTQTAVWPNSLGFFLANVPSRTGQETTLKYAMKLLMQDRMVHVDT